MIIREATLADSPAIVQMTERFIHTTEYGRWLKPTQEGLISLIVRVMDLGTIVVAQNVSYIGDGTIQRQVGPGELVGLLALACLKHPVNQENYADELIWWVEPEWRRGTVGPKMLRYAERWARHKGCSMIKMVAPEGEGGPDLDRFYKWNDYTALERAYLKLLEPIVGE